VSERGDARPAARNRENARAEQTREVDDVSERDERDTSIRERAVFEEI
jgi:hypothetical protein